MFTVIVYNVTNLAKNLRRAKTVSRVVNFFWTSSLNFFFDCISFRFVKSSIYVFNPSKANDEFQDMKHIKLYDSS